MAEAPNKTRILNGAVTRIGSSERLTSIDDPSSTTAQRARMVWDDLRRALMVRHPFNFAIERFLLNADSTPPAFGWLYRYRLPANRLRWLPPAPNTREYFDGEREGDFILTNRVAPLPVRCIVDVESVASWDAMFVMAMTVALAEILAHPVTESAALAQAMGDIADRAIREAKRVDGLETGQRRRQPARASSSWLGARNRTAYGGWRDC